MSYGSYFSTSGRAVQPVDISPSAFLIRSPSYHAGCAFPAWPQRSTLSSRAPGCELDLATSYLSDEDLFPPDLPSSSSSSATAAAGDDDDDDDRSLSSAGSSGYDVSSGHLPQHQQQQQQQQQRRRRQHQTQDYHRYPQYQPAPPPPQAVVSLEQQVCLQPGRMALQQEAVRSMLDERERRRRQAQRSQRGASLGAAASSRRSPPRSKPAQVMTPIAEVVAVQQ